MRMPVCFIPAVLMLAACAQPGPEACARANDDINLFSMARNSVTGSYGACLDSLRSELASLRLEGASLRAEAAQLEAQAATLAGERRAAAERLAALNAEQADLLSRIAQGGNSGTVGQTKEAIAQANSLTQDIERLNQTGGADPAIAAELKERQETLDQLTDIMLNI